MPPTGWWPTARGPRRCWAPVAANVLNNLPAFLVALPHVTGTDNVVALLFGVNVGPTVLVTGSLAGLLWLEAARRDGLEVGGLDYARVGLVAGVPALLAGIAVLSLGGRDAAGSRRAVPRLAGVADTTLYEAAGGMPFFEALVDRFYEGVASDPRAAGAVSRARRPGAGPPAPHLVPRPVLGRPHDLQRRAGPSPPAGPPPPVHHRRRRARPVAAPHERRRGGDGPAARDRRGAAGVLRSPAADAMRNIGLTITVPGTTGASRAS